MSSRTIPIMYRAQAFYVRGRPSTTWTGIINSGNRVLPGYSYCDVIQLMLSYVQVHTATVHICIEREVQVPLLLFEASRTEYPREFGSFITGTSTCVLACTSRGMYQFLCTYKYIYLQVSRLRLSHYCHIMLCIVNFLKYK